MAYALKLTSRWAHTSKAMMLQVEVSLLDGAGATLLEYSTSGNTLANTYTVLDQSKTTVTSSKELWISLIFLKQVK